tara:strand:- start:210 stop:563 length:354 start_codon:yes stop_codon:yes gene_type:complete
MSSFLISSVNYSRGNERKTKLVFGDKKSLFAFLSQFVFSLRCDKAHIVATCDGVIVADIRLHMARSDEKVVRFGAPFYVPFVTPQDFNDLFLEEEIRIARNASFVDARKDDCGISLT